MSEHILVLGGAGYIGDALVDILLKSKQDIRVYDSLVYESEYRKEVPFILGDVRDYDRLKPHLAWAHVVVNLAAIVGDGACALNPLAATEVNYEAVEFLANNFNDRLVNISSCSVYGSSEGLLNENSTTNPLSLYASMKLKTEKLFENKNAITFRLGTLFGLSGTQARPRLDLVLNTLTAKAVVEHRLKVFGGEQYRPLLHVKDAAQAIADNITTSHTGIFNLHSENIKIIDLAKEIQKRIPNTELDVVETSFEDSRNYRADSQKAIDAFGFRPIRSTADGIREVAKLIEEKRIKDINNPRYTNQGFLTKLNGVY